MAVVDPRMDRLERVVDRVQDQINQLHSTSMQMVTTAFGEMERRLAEKIDQQSGAMALELSKLRDQVVPMSEHQHLMDRVDQLWARDLGARSDWEEAMRRLPVLWDERTRIRAALAMIGAIEIAAGIAAGIYTALHR